jgi:hypothetical protein
MQFYATLCNLTIILGYDAILDHVHKLQDEIGQGSGWAFSQHYSGGWESGSRDFGMPDIGERCSADVGFSRSAPRGWYLTFVYLICDYIRRPLSTTLNVGCR